jgi:hypothetical protein
VPDPQLHDLSSLQSSAARSTEYRILRKGSRYNIFGPDGRVFSKYKSASVVGPRWEELTHTPWPYVSSAYLSGSRLWELGVIEREQVGQRTLPPSSSARPAPAQRQKARQGPLKLVTPPLALPAPRIDLDKQKRLLQALHRNPALLFEPDVRRALQNEVDYFRPEAKWAQHLLRLLARYERRQRHAKTTGVDSQTILARHIAWQEEQAALPV